MNMTAYPYEEPVAPESVNIHPRRLANVVRQYQRQQSAGAFPGGQLVLRRNGKLVINLAIGTARGFRPQEATPTVSVQPRTPFLMLSAGKPLAATAIAMLEDRGLLDVNAPIADIFPEFAKHGKEQITTLDVLTHRSGIRMPEFAKRVDLWSGREAVQNALIETVPIYPRGTLAYHVYEYGWILSEITHRVDGRSLPDFFKQEIAAPLGLPALEYGLGDRDIDSLAFSYWLGRDKVIVGGENVAETYESQNSVEFINARNPAVCLVSDAASLAGFYDFILNGGRTLAGEQLISEQTLRKYTTRHVRGWDRSLDYPLTVGRGFAVGSLFPSSFGWWNTGQCFGHAGGFCCLGFADYDTRICAVIATNGNRSLNDFTRRFLPLAQGLRRACNR